MLRLSQRMDVWRWTVQPSGRRVQVLAERDIECLFVPISSFDQLPAFAREATDLLLVPRWLRELGQEDQVRSGRRVDNTGAVLQYRYTIAGVRRFRAGLRHTEYFVGQSE